jgi:hypothetical protein
MTRPRIGEILQRMGVLSSIDIDEILEQQAASHGKFGEIALSWGLCEPGDVLEACCIQFADRFDWLDLSACHIDAKVILSVPADLARELHIVPLVSIADQMVVASARPVDGDEWMRILEATGKDVRFILAEPEVIDHAIEVYYPEAA